MYNNKSILGIIPARGGSKGLPGKNIRMLCGKPLIAWSIEAGLKSKYLDEVMVTTDSEEIAKVSKEFGAAVPFIRPVELALDHSTTFEVIAHTIDFYRTKVKRAFDYIVLLEPTSPLRELEDIDNPIEILLKHKRAKSIVSVARLESGHPEFNINIDPYSGFIKKNDGNVNFNVLRRQDLNDVFFFDGTIYISSVETLLEKKTFYHEATLGHIVPRWKSYEVDEIYDLICIESLLQSRLKKLF